MNIVYLIGMLLAIFFVLFGITVDFKAAQWSIGQLKLFFDPASASDRGRRHSGGGHCLLSQTGEIHPQAFQIMLEPKPSTRTKH